MSHEKKTVIVLTCLVVLIGGIFITFGNKGPSPVTETRNRLRALETAVTEFADNNGALPQALSDLSLPENQTTDHAGTPFHYKVDGIVVTISSLGADGKVGGAAFNADKTVSFSWPE